MTEARLSKPAEAKLVSRFARSASSVARSSLPEGIHGLCHERVHGLCHRVDEENALVQLHDGEDLVKDRK